METFEMNVYTAAGAYSGNTVTCNVLHFDPATELRMVECEGIFYVVDCEGDAQARGGTIPTQLFDARHARIVLEFIKLETDYLS